MKRANRTAPIKFIMFLILAHGNYTTETQVLGTETSQQASKLNTTITFLCELYIFPLFLYEFPPRASPCRLGASDTVYHPDEMRISFPVCALPLTHCVLK